MSLAGKDMKISLADVIGYNCMIFGQLHRLANIFDNLGQVVLASVVLPLFLGTKEKVGWGIILGILAVAMCWWFSLRLERVAERRREA